MCARAGADAGAGTDADAGADAGAGAGANTLRKRQDSEIGATHGALVRLHHRRLRACGGSDAEPAAKGQKRNPGRAWDHGA